MGGRSGFAVITGESRRVAKPVGAAAAPTPVNTQSLRRENYGNDISVNLVPVGTTSVWGKDNESKELEGPIKEEQAPTSKSAPWATSSSVSNSGDAPQSSASESNQASQSAQKNVTPILKGKSWADTSDEDDDEGDVDNSVQQQINQQQIQQQYEVPAGGYQRGDARDYNRDFDQYPAGGGDIRSGGYRTGGVDSGGDSRGYNQDSRYGGGDSSGMYSPERRSEAPREPIRGALGGPSMALPQREETEAEAIERNRQEIEFIRMEKEARARREEEERQREAYAEDIRRRDAKRAAQQEKRKEETNRLWEKPDDFDPREHRRKRSSGDVNDGGSGENDEPTGEASRGRAAHATAAMNAPPPPPDAWGGASADTGSMTIEEISLQQATDVSREEEMNRAHDLQRSSHNLRQSDRSEFNKTPQFAQVEVHSKAAGNALKANVAPGRMLFDPKSGRMVEARTEILQKGAGSKDRHKADLAERGGGGQQVGQKQDKGGKKQRQRQRQQQEQRQQAAYVDDSDDELNSEEEAELRRLEELQAKKMRKKEKERAAAAAAAAAGGGVPMSGSPSTGIEGVATFTMSTGADSTVEARRLTKQEKFQAKIAAKKEAAKAAKKEKIAKMKEEKKASRLAREAPSGGMGGLEDALGSLRGLEISSDLSGLLNAAPDALSLFTSDAAAVTMSGLDEQDHGKVDLDFYGATGCIDDDDDDYHGVGVDMAGILGNPDQDAVNAVADLVDSDDEPALDGLYGSADSSGNFVGDRAARDTRANRGGRGRKRGGRGRGGRGAASSGPGGGGNPGRGHGPPAVAA